MQKVNNDSAAPEDLFDGDPAPFAPSPVEEPFPVDAFPAPIAAMVNAVAEALQVDPAMPAVSALTALAACAAGRVEVHPRRDWREQLCLYTATVARRGT